MTASRFRRLVLRSIVVWAILGLLAWLDRSAVAGVQHAAIFGAIWGAIVFVADALGAAGGAIATTVAGAVAYLSSAVAWLAGRVGDLLVNTGSMFAKVWDYGKTFFQDVLKPALQWLHDFYENVKSWLSRIFKPILEWAYRVRDELKSLYTRFVRPVLDALDTSRRILDILAKLHVPFAQTLENVVTDVEQTILANYLRLLGYVNRVIDTLNSYFTLDGLLQRFVFLRSLERDVYYTWRVLMNSRVRPLTAAEQQAIHDGTKVTSTDELTVGFGQFLAGEQNDFSGWILTRSDAFTAQWLDDA